ncbi:hypothetical protein D9Q98_010089 [Chlorella vulgaris]|uniref:Uncharacterized protein n=1 Tax=Chlorella vulgaris TaxID=3077 RepID=A0A9D4TMN6_CHLVU|nr:hypothetical protein D9Q98_010089 [Chlorella vulgaris]
MPTWGRALLNQADLSHALGYGRGTTETVRSTPVNGIGSSKLALGALISTLVVGLLVGIAVCMARVKREARQRAHRQQETQQGKGSAAAEAPLGPPPVIVIMPAEEVQCAVKEASSPPPEMLQQAVTLSGSPGEGSVSSAEGPADEEAAAPQADQQPEQPARGIKPGHHLPSWYVYDPARPAQQTGAVAATAV